MINTLRETLKGARVFWLLLAITMLAGTGLRRFFRSGSDLTIAKVNGVSIDASIFRKKMSKEIKFRERLRSFGLDLGSTVDPRRVLSQCIDDILIDNISKELSVCASDEMLIEAVSKYLPTYVFDDKGGIDMNQYKTVVSNAWGSTVEEFEAEQAHEIRAGLTKKVFELLFFDKKQKVGKKDDDRDKKLSIEYKIFDFSHYKEQAKKWWSELALDEQNLFKLRVYEINKSKYKIPGYAELLVCEIDKDKLAHQIVVTEQQIMDYYNRFKLSKYSSQKSYTVDFFAFENNDKSKDQAIAAFKDEQDFSHSAEKFDEYKKAAKKKDLSLEAYRNHDVVLGQNKFSQKLEDAILSLSNPMQVSEPISVDGKTYLVRLVSVKTATTKKLEEVKKDIETTIKDKMVEYEAEKINNLVKKAQRDNFEEGFKGLMSHIESIVSPYNPKEFLKIKEVSSEKEGSSVLGSKISANVDGLEKMSQGKVSEGKKDLVYIVTYVKKSSYKKADDVDQSLEDDVLSDRQEELALAAAKDERSAVFADLKWSDNSAAAKSISDKVEKIAEKLQIAPSEADKLNLMISPSQVLLASKEGGFALVRLQDQVEQKESKESDASIDWFREIVAAELENATIETYADKS